MVNQHATDAEIESILKAHFELYDWQSIYQHHDAITGTQSQHAADDYMMHISQAMHVNNEKQKEILQEKVKEELNIDVDLKYMSLGNQNDTVDLVPLGQSPLVNQKELLVVVHNPSGKSRNSVQI